MLEFQEKNKFRRLLYSKASLILLFIVLFFIVKAVIGVYYKEKASGENLLISRVKMAELEKREDAKF